MRKVRVVIMEGGHAFEMGEYGGDDDGEILKPRTDKRVYRGVVLENELQALIISDPETDKVTGLDVESLSLLFFLFLFFLFFLFYSSLASVGWEAAPYGG